MYIGEKVRLKEVDNYTFSIKEVVAVVYSIHIMQQSACLVVNSIMVYSYGFFNYTTTG